MKFKPYQLNSLAARPKWWSVKVDEIISLCSSLSEGRLEVIAETPNSYPVFAVYYNCEKLQKPGVNWSAAASSSNPENFSTSKGKQTAVICAGLHGAEAEGVAAAINLISLLEYGKDLRGKSNDLLLSLLNEYRLVILPCVNMDGRSICPDHLMGVTNPVFRKASQGAWLNGKYIDWRESKEYFPLPLDKVEFPGGYPNGDGFNIMHDCGNVRTAEAKAIYELVEEEQADLFLNLHSCESGPFLIQPGSFNYKLHIERGRKIRNKLNEKLYTQKLIDKCNEGGKHLNQKIDFNSMVTMISGALALTFESGVNSHKGFDALLDVHYTLFETVLADGLKSPFCVRNELVKYEMPKKEMELCEKQMSLL